MAEILKDFVDSVVEMKKEEFRQKMGTTFKFESMVEDFKNLNLHKEKIDEIISIIKKYI